MIGKRVHKYKNSNSKPEFGNRKNIHVPSYCPHISGLVQNSTFHYCVEFPLHDSQMAGAAVAAHDAHFRWKIINPFVPFKRWVATFYHGSPTLTHFIVTLDPCGGWPHSWRYKFSLKSGEGEDVIDTTRTAVNITMNGEPMANDERIGFSFSRRNRHTFEFQVYVYTDQQIISGHLVIDVKISEVSFQRDIIDEENELANIINQGNGLMFDNGDLATLSVDLLLLFVHSYYFNLTLMASTTHRSSFRVHYFMIRARWSNFFAEHPEVNNGIVEVMISDNLLHDILVYMYSSQLETAQPQWGNPSYVSELFQVTDRYRLYHLHKVFARDEIQQVRTTLTGLTTHTRNFQLEYAHGRPKSDRELAFAWHFDEYNFLIQFHLRVKVPWFAYELHSTSEKDMKVLVTLDIRKRFGTRTVHQKAHTIRTALEVEGNWIGDEKSGYCEFIGNVDDLTDFIQGRPRYERGERDECSIDCILHLTDGSAVTQVWSEDNQMQLQSDWERVNVLSDHMYGLYRRPIWFATDFEAQCPLKFPAITGEYLETYLMHKAIFAARVPEWRAVLGNLQEGEEIPDVWNFEMDGDAFDPLLTYLYTGKSYPVPIPHLNEIDNFAATGGMNTLRNFVHRMRLQQLP